eukprot:CAMPEP_0172543038 /NCGR_PEP_ID=MMETSP1067-20121228/13527_1 /TAXON_ID=265564 ORGANISM="Thalassiosira punctigera, Strain Tpunct2005C2" /NCGR_SAMPLE_ID=MMETSP1067 /ASSEMBLY_ACC=CAM_ASM_000444 /LENGTH=140 /DNA_ID=CAMNT_0013329367 /DNA_START=94 /DNA_END=516 /DNA_ORIENTATION=-
MNQNVAFSLALLLLAARSTDAGKGQTNAPTVFVARPTGPAVTPQPTPLPTNLADVISSSPTPPPTLSVMEETADPTFCLAAADCEAAMPQGWTFYENSFPTKGCYYKDNGSQKLYFSLGTEEDMSTPTEELPGLQTRLMC